MEKEELILELINRSNGNSDDSRIAITTLALLIEKNVSDDLNDNDYRDLIPEKYLELKLNVEEIKKIANSLLSLVKDDIYFSDLAVWAIGKTYDEEYISKVFLEVFSRYISCSHNLLKQSLFALDNLGKKFASNFAHELNAIKNNIDDLELERIVERLL